MTKTRLTGLSRRYRAALRQHLQAGARPRAAAADRLGRQAVALGLDTLALARIHEQALVALRLRGDSSRTTHGRRKRADSFFAEAIAPIEETHRAARKTGVHLQQLSAMLSHRTKELAVSHRRLQEGKLRRRGVEDALRKSSKNRAALLAKARQLHHRLRRLAHRILAAQENNRHQMSRELHDEIAQTLLGIHVRLLALRRGAATSSQDLKKEIAKTQRLVEKSARTMKRFTREFGLPHES